VAVAEFLCAVCEEADERPVDIAEAEEAEVVGADEIPQGLKPDRFVTTDAALKRRSSTVVPAILITTPRPDEAGPPDSRGRLSPHNHVST
jgi:hypothetical protein